MSLQFLLPNKYKKVGWLILIPATIFGIILMFTGFDAMPLTAPVFAIFSNEIFKESNSYGLIHTNITLTATGVLFIVGALLAGFSKEKTEDELFQIFVCHRCSGLF